MTATTPARLLLVDDHPVYREGLTAALRDALPAVEVQGAGSVEQAWEMLEQPFDMVLADQRLPDGEGLMLLAQVRVRWPTLAGVLISGVDDPELAERAAAIGCQGFVPKTLDARAIADAVARVSAGERCFPPGATVAAAGVNFTDRQVAVLRMAARGFTSRAIGDALGIGERTVKDHLAVIYGRLDAGTRAEAVARAAALGLLEPLPRPKGRDLL